MKIKLKLSIILPLVNLLSYSQTTLPSFKTTGSDTVYSVSKETINAYNLSINYLDACNEVADSLQSRIDTYENAVIPALEDVIELSKGIEDNLKDQVAESGALIDLYKKSDKKSSRKILSLKVQRNILAATACVGIIFSGLSAKSCK